MQVIVMMAEAELALAVEMFYAHAQNAASL
jgi:hypothetical protein